MKLSEKVRLLPQEGLKLIACLTMLLDHSAAVLVRDYELYILLRNVGRIAFPIYCWLLVEGSHHTRSPLKYALRLFAGAVLAELPFDCSLFGGPTWAHQSVMVTLLLGFGALFAMEKCGNLMLKMLILVIFGVLADVFCTDYGGYGVLLIGALELTRSRGLPAQTIAMAVLCALIPSMDIDLFGWNVSMELFGLLAMVPIAFCSGKKATKSKALQWAFYLFYPVHLGILTLL